MADKELVIQERLEHEGLLDFKALYQFAHLWLKDKGYVTAEKKYGEKIIGNEREIKVEWESTKTISEYFKIEVTMKVELKDMSDVEVEIDGVKKKMNKGRLKIDFKGNLIRDPLNKWSSTPLYRFLKDTYNKYIIPARVEGMQIQVFNVVTDLKEELKALLEITASRA